MKWVVIDNLMPNQSAAINLHNVDCISWAGGNMAFEFGDGSCVEYECEQKVFVEVLSRLEVVSEIE